MEVAQTQRQTLLVFTNLPDEASAHALATALVVERVAACVNVLAPCRSVYHWQGKVEEATEIPLLIKTTAGCYAALEAAIRARHPYELPEIVAVPVAHGLPEYLDWLVIETRTETPVKHPDGNPPTC
jgi:periplasmic divalent cation tolerance protein